MKTESPAVQLQMNKPDFPNNLPFVTEEDRFGFQLQFFVRMLFSCLVDADYLDTEKSIEKIKSNSRSGYPSIKELHCRFWRNFNRLREKADSATVVNQQREIVLRDCLTRAGQAPGLFSLTVPTGGGKTLASLSFALEHAKQHGKRRIIYVIPFTSISEQNACGLPDKGKAASADYHLGIITASIT